MRWLFCTSLWKGSLLPRSEPLKPLSRGSSGALVLLGRPQDPFSENITFVADPWRWETDKPNPGFCPQELWPQFLLTVFWPSRTTAVSALVYRMMGTSESLMRWCDLFLECWNLSQPISGLCWTRSLEQPSDLCLFPLTQPGKEFMNHPVKSG